VGALFTRRTLRTGATSGSYNLARGDIGFVIRATEVAMNNFGTSESASTPETAVVTDAPLINGRRHRTSRHYGKRDKRAGRHVQPIR
jgi:hypothetical protein